MDEYVPLWTQYEHIFHGIGHPYARFSEGGAHKFLSILQSAFLPLGPLGQGGYSLLVAGADLSIFFGDREGDQFPNLAITGDSLQIVLFCGSFILWSMGLAWIFIAFMTIFEVARKNKIPFGMAYWGLIFPHGVFAMLSVQMGHTLNSMFFKVFGALWSSEYILFS